MTESVDDKQTIDLRVRFKSAKDVERISKLQALMGVSVEEMAADAFRIYEELAIDVCENGAEYFRKAKGSNVKRHVGLFGEAETEKTD